MLRSMQSWPASISITTRRRRSRRRSPTAWTAAVREVWGNASSVHHFGQQAKAARGRGAGAGGGAAGRRGRPRWSSRPAAPRATTSPSAAPPRRSRPTGRRHLIATRHRARGGAEHAQGAGAPRLAGHASAGRCQRIVSPERAARRHHRRHRARLGDARQQRDRHHSADRRDSRRSPRRTARWCTPTPCRPPARSRSTSRRSASICCRSRRTSSTGPRASGALWMRKGVRLLPFMTGGRQERNRRAGTENVARHRRPRRRRRRARCRRCAREAERLAALRDRLEQGSSQRVAGAERNGAAEPRVAEHDQHQLRAHRIRVAAHRARSRRHRRVVRVGVLVGHAGTVARAEGDGTSPRPHAQLDPLQPRREQHRSGCRSRDHGAAAAGREAAESDDVGGRR